MTPAPLCGARSSCFDCHDLTRVTKHLWDTLGLTGVRWEWGCHPCTSPFGSRESAAARSPAGYCGVIVGFGWQTATQTSRMGSVVGVAFSCPPQCPSPVLARGVLREMVENWHICHRQGEFIGTPSQSHQILEPALLFLLAPVISSQLPQREISKITSQGTSCRSEDSKKKNNIKK